MSIFEKIKNNNLTFKDIEELEDINIKDKNNITILHYYFYSRKTINSELAKYIIDKGFDINSIDDYFYGTILHVYLRLYKEIDTEFVKYILDKGIDANVKNIYKETILDCMIRFLKRNNPN